MGRFDKAIMAVGFILAVVAMYLLVHASTSCCPRPAPVSLNCPGDSFAVKISSNMKYWDSEGREVCCRWKISVEEKSVVLICPRTWGAGWREN
jgi:hypothetical protein